MKVAEGREIMSENVNEEQCEIHQFIVSSDFVSWKN